VVSLGLAAIFAANLAGRVSSAYFSHRFLALATGTTVTVVGRLVALAFLVLAFAILYNWAPGWRKRRWQWFTPGGVIGIGGWLIASLGLRLYLHFFNSYSLTYGSLGAVIILLTWFYLTGLMLLVGAEINSTLEEAAREQEPAPPEGSS
jgi:membrane protein